MFTGLDGKAVTIAFMPGYADKIAEALQSLRGEPQLIALEKASGEQRK
jgi:hypothetical protein